MVIRITNCRDVEITGTKIFGPDNGFEIFDSEDVKVKNVYCETRTAVYGERVRGLKVTNLSHDDRGGINRLTLLAVLVRRAAHGNV